MATTAPEITALTATTGARGPQRNSGTHPPTRLFGSGDLVTRHRTGLPRGVALGSGPDPDVRLDQG